MGAVRHLNTEQLAERLGVKPEAVRKMRQESRGPAYIKGEGSRAMVRYRLADVEAWEKSRLVVPATA
jgi:DNA-directed RNA polymerase sigma subunit (sigma70/sigma32)